MRKQGIMNGKFSKSAVVSILKTTGLDGKHYQGSYYNPQMMIYARGTYEH